MSDVGGATLQSTTEKSSRVDPNRASHGRWRHRDSSVKPRLFVRQLDLEVTRDMPGPMKVTEGGIGGRRG